MKLSLAGWSLNGMFRAPRDRLSLLDFPALARDRFALDAVELNNIYFASTDADYLDQLVVRADDAGVRLLNIAVDEQGELCDTDETARRQAVRNYARWIDVARRLGCDAIRANSGGGRTTDREAAERQVIRSFQDLATAARGTGVKILIENHWGLSMDPKMIVRLVESVRASHGQDACAALVDWGNWPDQIDRYDAIATVMPLAHAVHAKVNDIDEQLAHPRFDHARCLKISRQAGYDGYLGIEYEGNDDPLIGVERAVRLLGGLIA